jgi:hypothetical protein
MKTLIITSPIIFILVLVVTYFHLVYTVDTVALAFGGNYYISTIAVPLAIAIVVALITYAILNSRNSFSVKDGLWLLLSSSLGAGLPVGLALWALNQPH